MKQGLLSLTAPKFVQPKNRVKALSAAILAFTMAGGSVVLATVLAQRIGNLTTSCLSIPGAFLVLLPLCVPLIPGIRKNEPGLKISARALVLCGLQALGGIVLFRLMTGLASQTTSVGVAGIVFATGPLVLALGGAVFYRDKLRSGTLIALVLVSAGLILLQTDKTLSSSPEGFVYLFLAVAGESAMSLIRRKDGEKALDYRLNALLTVLWALVLLLPFLLIDWATHGLPRITGSDLVLLLVYGTGSTAIGYLTWSYAATRLTSAAMGLCSAATPLFTLLMSITVFGERPDLSAVLGWLIALAGVLIGLLKRHSAEL